MTQTPEQIAAEPDYAFDIIAYRLIHEPLWAEVTGYVQWGKYIVLGESGEPQDTHRLRIPMRLVDGKREFDKSRQPEWGEL